MKKLISLTILLILLVGCGDDPLNDVTNDNSTLKDLVVGKTFFIKSCENDVGTIRFQNNGKVWREWNDSTEYSIFEYLISGNTLTLKFDEIVNNEEAVTTLNFKDSSSKYIRFTYTNDIGDVITETPLYYSKSDAQNAPMVACGDSSPNGQNQELQQELQYVSNGETDEDSCDSYKNCNYSIIDNSEINFTKIWTYKNSGDVPLNNLKFNLIDDSKNGIQVNNIRTDKSTINVGEEVEIKADFYISKELVDGKYEARWEILNGDNSSIKTPPKNGVSNQAHMWFKFDLHRGVTNDNSTLKDLVVGKTFFMKFCENDVGTIRFQNNGKLWQEWNDSTEYSISEYLISGNTLTINEIVNDEEAVSTLNFKDSSSKYIRFTDDIEDFISTLYYSKSDAQNAPRSDNCHKREVLEIQVKNMEAAQYTYNENIVIATNAMLNMVGNANCQQLQVSISKEDDRVQFTTDYGSKEEFDNAFSNNRLTLNQDHLYFYLELGGVPQDINDKLFSVTFTKNNDGSYNIDTTGYFSNRYENSENKISGITAKNVIFIDGYRRYGNNNSCSDSNNNG